MLVLTQRRDIPSSAIAAVKYNVWCAVGNTIHVVQSHHVKMEVREGGEGRNVVQSHHVKMEVREEREEM